MPLATAFNRSEARTVPALGPQSIHHADGADDIPSVAACALVATRAGSRTLVAFLPPGQADERLLLLFIVISLKQGQDGVRGLVAVQGAAHCKRP
jgi:hypothetical protein